MSVFCLLYIDWSCCGNSFATTVIPSVDSFGPPCCFSDMPLNLCSVECFATLSSFCCGLLLSPLESLLYTFLILNPTLAFCLVGLTKSPCLLYFIVLMGVFVRCYKKSSWHYMRISSSSFFFFSAVFSVLQKRENGTQVDMQVCDTI